MKTMTCEATRDRLPELLAGELDGLAALELEQHLARCEACAQERAAVALVRAMAPVAPAGLEARVVRAVRAGAVPRREQGSLRPLAIAAGMAFALLTGGLLLREAGLSLGERGAGVADVTMGWPVVQDPILRVTPALYDLSVEELESLLAELES